MARGRNPVRGWRSKAPGSSTAAAAFERVIARLPGPSRSKPIKHRARDAFGFGGLAAVLHRSLEPGRAVSTQDFDKPRCREASRPAGPLGPRAPRAPSVFLRAMRISKIQADPGA